MRSVAREIGPELWPLFKGRFQEFIESKLLTGLLSNFTYMFTGFWTTHTNFFPISKNFRSIVLLLAEILLRANTKNVASR